MKMENGLFLKDECYAIQGAIFEVYRVIGCGFFEPVYQECLEKEFRFRGIPFVAQLKAVIFDTYLPRRGPPYTAVMSSMTDSAGGFSFMTHVILPISP
ncbi:MAG: GxxExxY protein [Desulfuromonadales bacterium]|nr:GxxExxY protein [Desulfuromonadales bacterium]